MRSRGRLRRRRLGLAVVLLAAAACSGGSPSSPSNPQTPGTPSTPPSGTPGSGRLVDVFTDAGLGSATVTSEGVEPATSDATGSFTLRPPGGGTLNITISAPGYVERRTRLAIPGAPATLSLIPASFDLVAFDAMARTHEGQLVRWTSPPSLIIQRNLLDYSDDGGHTVSDQSISDADLGCLEARTREAVSVMSGNALTAGAAQPGTAAPGSRVDTPARGSITVWGTRNLGGAAGRGGVAYTIPGLTVVAGVVYLEVAAQGGLNHASCSGSINILRHEVGHALGYQHVTTRTSVMQPVNAPNVTDFDRQAFTVFYRRSPGNGSPDTDSTTFRANSLGRLAHWVLP